MVGTIQATARFQDSNFFQKAIKMVLTGILNVIFPLSGFRFLPSHTHDIVCIITEELERSQRSIIPFWLWVDLRVCRPSYSGILSKLTFSNNGGLPVYYLTSACLLLSFFLLALLCRVYCVVLLPPVKTILYLSQVNQLQVDHSLLNN